MAKTKAKTPPKKPAKKSEGKAPKKPAKKKAPLKGTARPVRQQTLPGLPTANKHIMQLAESLRTIRGQRMRIQDAEAEAQEKLIAAMDAIRLDKFELDGQECIIDVADPRKKIKFRKIKEG